MTTAYLKSNELLADRYSYEVSGRGAQLHCVSCQPSRGFLCKHAYVVSPQLRTAPVFGGIAGIMAGEQGDAEDVGRKLPLELVVRSGH